MNKGKFRFQEKSMSFHQCRENLAC